MKNDRWLLPEGIEEVLPPQAQHLEALRRTLLDRYRCWGYELVIPPLIEYLDSLLIGTADDLDLQTFKLTDQLNGRMLGVRADMTPQVARIDAHLLKRAEPTRLCYIGSVLHTRPDGFAGSRSPMQVGAELYGHSGIHSDVEIIHLMIETLGCCGIENIYMDLGHVGVYRGLVAQAGLTPQQEAELFDALQRKAKPEINTMLRTWMLAPALAEMLLALVDLNGDEVIFTTAGKILKSAQASVHMALDEMRQIALALQARVPNLDLHFDLAELRGYHYHTGVVFAAYVPGQGQAVAQGGRYDGIGKVFGNARPATGFSADLRTLLTYATPAAVTHTGIWAPASDDAQLQAAIAGLRAQGERVIVVLPGQQGDAARMGCDRQLIQSGAQWRIESV
ncbi:MAG: ATP phosphoribosyltransferase regulatory subunit [Gammaproteobacteria bacterium]|nr:ATP phosphoribosyltransferase regulatory subunit [Gammaproteobacteria bacterium]